MVAYKLIKDDNAGTLIGGIASWKWLHITCAIVTFAIFLPLVFFLPNTPVEAKWLSTEEKVHTIEMIRRTRAGIVNSTWKWKHVKECFLDVKSWLFMFGTPYTYPDTLLTGNDDSFHMFFNELPNNTSAQTPLILVGFGFTPAQSALFNIAKPLWGMVLILISATLLYATNLGTGYTCALSYVPCLIGGIIELSSPWSNKVALVVGTQISSFKPSYLLGLNWAGTTTTGHTKKVTLMSSCIVAAAVANMISPEYIQTQLIITKPNYVSNQVHGRFWQSKYSPRYVLPWSFMTAFWFISPMMCLIIRLYLNHQNKLREKTLGLGEQEQDGGQEQGSESEEDARGGFLGDMTDRENLRFVYPL